jgi:2-amino-1-hydroxyethylphosphonate dioxygenase (glycine-forming)
MSKSVSEWVDQIFDLLSASTDQEYIGEAVSQLQHALQTAQSARLCGADSELILAALMHDIGHLSAAETAPTMSGLGVVNHEVLGAQLALEAGCSRRLASLIGGHVAAKRYLAYKNVEYFERLSPASLGTLSHQGGPMSSDQAQTFESAPFFRDFLRLRSWDELAKDRNAQVDPLDSYRSLLEQHLSRVD